MDVDMGDAPATTVHPRTVVKPRSAATIAAASDSHEATEQNKL
jgi:hypothetical protein